MKKLVYIACLALLSMICSCNDWTETKPLDFEPNFCSEEYYAALREYKKSDHPIAFGWFGSWSGQGASLYYSLLGIPDSVDLVSIWGGAYNINESQKEELKYCQEVKGTRFMSCNIITNVGAGYTPSYVTENWEANGFQSADEATKAFWGYTGASDIEPAIRKYANAICDSVYKYGYDGFDIDFEPHSGAKGDLVSYDDRVAIFVEELGKRLGPESGTGKLLAVDGEPQYMPSHVGKYFDYFIVQAYNCPGDYRLDSRIKSSIDNFNGHLSAKEVARKYVVTEDFEKNGYAPNGGKTDFVDSEGNKMPSLIGMARWLPTVDGVKVPKGGIGTYHMEYEYPNMPEYKWLRQSIQIMNPSKK